MINYIVKDLVEVLKKHEGYVAFATTADFAMGSGVAKQMDKEFNLKSQFKNRFDKFYPDAGDMYRLENLVDDMVFCIIDKRTRYDSVDLDILEKCFKALRQEMISTRITEIYIPKIGCGADGLYWEEEVLPIIERVFGTDDLFTINVCVLSEESIPNNDIKTEDTTDKLYEIDSNDVILYDELDQRLVIYADIFDGYEDGKIVSLDMTNFKDKGICKYKMVLEWDDGIILYPVNE